MNETIRSIKFLGEKLDTMEFTEEPESQKELSETPRDEIPHTKLYDIVENDQVKNKNVFAKAVKEMITINIIRSDNFNSEDSKRKLDQLERVNDEQLGFKLEKRQTLQADQIGKLNKKALEYRNYPYFTEIAPLAQVYVKKHKEFAIEMLEMEKSNKKILFKAGTIAERRFDYELSKIYEDSDSKFYDFLLTKYR